MLDKLKKMADQAKVKAGPMAQQAKEKAGPMAEQAKGKATELASKAAPAVSQGVEKAAGSLDKATKGRYTGHIDKVQGVVQQTAQKVGDKAAGAGTGTVAPPVTPVADFGDPDAVVIQPPSPVVIPSEPVVVPPPAPVPTFEGEPGLNSPTTTTDGREDNPRI
ncbi:antitoxin [Jatrophihabitans sp.]|jgi:hypothetical protein|uniref:antitoxin n=1 Tax=Jatrophihabitans sp. TaxID=1932789 RepID=UPI002F0C060B